jgi:hypothetical protein
MGLSFVISGVVPPLLSLTAIALAVANYSNFMKVTIILLFHVAFLIYTIVYNIWQSKNVKIYLDDPDKFSSTSFYDNWILGYGSRWETEKKKEQ